MEKWILFNGSTTILILKLYLSSHRIYLHMMSSVKKELVLLKF